MHQACLRQIAANIEFKLKNAGEKSSKTKLHAKNVRISIRLFYSPVCSAVQFFSYKRWRSNVKRASGFIFWPLGLKNGASLLFGDSDVMRRI